jgi:hypothetical protein
MATTYITDQINGKTYVEIDKDAELDYTIDLDEWCDARGVDVASYTVVLPTGSAAVVLDDTRTGNQITVTVKLPTPSARATRMHLVDGFTVRFTTTASPRSGSALIDDRTLWLLPREA